MNKKILETGKGTSHAVKHTGVHEQNVVTPKPYNTRAHVNGQFSQIDPKILQRYSLDDNGGSYKGL